MVTKPTHSQRTRMSGAPVGYLGHPPRARDIFTSRRDRHKMIRSYKGISPQFPSTAYVDESAQLIGDVVCGEHSSVWMGAVLRGDVHEIRVGHYSNIQDNSVLH